MKTPELNLAHQFLASSPLWHNTLFGLTQFELPKLDLSSFNASSVPDNLRLGNYIEKVFLQLLQHSKNYEVLFHNLPIRNRERTLGEIDFILRDLLSSQLVHIELTYKFYLLDTTITDPILRWIGPNRKDGLLDKLEKLKYEQFKLLHSIESQKILYNSGIDHLIIVDKVCFKAQLFVPYGLDNIEISPLNPTCITGYWIRFDDFKKKTFLPYKYHLPSKLGWMDKPHNSVNWMDRATASAQVKNFLDRKYSPMVWLKKSDSDFEKLFVVW